mmetsp:Transcript_26541/g.44307  ORF Transcript_26541/g.44307 Transcript_26541/m.44307 type:complete len:123 (+) Transcript_26541:820-1188(+)
MKWIVSVNRRTKNGADTRRGRNRGGKKNGPRKSSVIVCDERKRKRSSGKGGKKGWNTKGRSPRQVLADMQHLVGIHLLRTHLLAGITHLLEATILEAMLTTEEAGLQDAKASRTTALVRVVR